jgi:hypothetical protein
MTHAPDCGALARDLCDCAPCRPVPVYDSRSRLLASARPCAPQRGHARVSEVEETGVRGSHPRAARALDWWARTRGTCRKLAAVTCSELS